MTSEEGDESAEVYLTCDSLEIEIARGVLKDMGILAVVRDLTARAYPLTLGHMGEYRLVVAAPEGVEARAALADALTDGVLVNGTVI